MGNNAHIKYLRCILLVLLWLSLSFSLAGQLVSEEGNRYIKNYSPKDYKGYPQIFDIIQDSTGIIYFTGNGITEFDGKEWRGIGPQSLKTYSLINGENGTIYVGAADDLGYLEVDSIGQYQFVSLKHLLPEQYKAFGQLRRKALLDHWVYFSSWTGMLLGLDTKNKAIKVWDRDGKLKILGVVNGQLFVEQTGLGLCVLEEGRIRPVAGMQQTQDFHLEGIVPFADTQKLLLTRYKGFFLLDQNKITAFPTEADRLLSKWSFKVRQLPDQSYLVTTLGQGLLQIDQKGHWIRTLNQAKGLIDDIPISTCLSKNGVLWVGTNAGLSKVDFLSPISHFKTDNQGYLLSIEDIKRHQGNLYLASSGRNGIVYLNAKHQQFENIKGLPEGQSFGLFMVGNDLIGTTDRGLYQINRTEAITKLSNEKSGLIVTTGAVSLDDSTQVFLGHQQGLALMDAKGLWKVTQLIEEIPENVAVRSIVEIKNGELYLGTEGQGVWKLIYSFDQAGKLQVKELKNFTKGNEGVDLGTTKVFKLGNSLRIAGSGGIYKLTDSKDRFLLDEALPTPGDPSEIQSGEISKDHLGESIVFYRQYAGKGILGRYTKDSSGILSFDQSIFRAVPNGDVLNTNVLYPEEDHILWVASQDGLIRLDRKAYADRPAFLPMIRMVEDDEGIYTYKGHGLAASPRLSYASNNLHFSFLLPSPQVGTQHFYRTQLVGFEKAWSAWSSKTERSFTNLKEGNYQFVVQAKNSIGELSPTTTYTFRILPPLWRTWWAYLLYFAIGVLSFLALSRWRNHQLLERSKKLQLTVDARTAETKQQLQQLTTINQIQELLVSALHLDNLYAAFGEQVSQLFNDPKIAIAIYNSVQDDYELPFTKEVTLPLAQLDRTILQFLKVNRKPLLFNKPKQAIEGGWASKIQNKEKGTFLAVPVLFDQRFLGAITLHNQTNTKFFDSADQKLMQTIAAQLGIAISNRQLYIEAQKAKANAEESNAAKSTFLSTVSHELRTPLTSVIGFAKIIKKRLDDRILPFVVSQEKKTHRAIKQVRENLDVVVSEGERLTNLINTVLDLAKIESGRFDWNIQRISIANVVRQAEAATSALFEEKSLSLFVEIEEALPDVEIDKDRLVQVMINLISNAVKFTDEGFVFIKVFKKGSAIVVQVEDTGMGISEEDLPKVFEKFKQVGDTLTDKPKGTGLGLPICKEIIDHHQGRLWADSEIGKGSVFAFSLPHLNESMLVTDHFPKARSSNFLLKNDSQSPKVIPSGKNILIVDDEPEIRNLLVQELSEAGYDCEQAINGKVALDMIANQAPDLIILDVMMPEINGFEVATILKANLQTQKIPILVVSITDDRKKLETLQIEGYFTKPIDIDRLLVKIEELIHPTYSNQFVKHNAK